MTDLLPILRGHLVKKNLDAIVFNTSEFLPSINLRYLSGFTGSDACIFVTRTECHLFTDGRYRIQALDQARGFRVHVVHRKIEALIRAIKATHVNRLGIEGSRVSYEFIEALMRRMPGLEILPLARRFLEAFRLRKGPEEIAKIKKAAHIAFVACSEMLSSGLSGKRESEVAHELESLFRRNGAGGIAFDTIVASGERSALPHGMPTEKVIGIGELVIMDYGCRFEGYNSDETVTCVPGTPSSDQKKIHKAVYEAHMVAIDSIKAGLKVHELDAIARRSIEKSGFGKYFMHGLGHGVGMEVHEPPRISPLGRGVLEEGMVFTIEPGIYLDGIGGIRLESLVYLGRNGPEIISEMPKELISVG
jgi:Xaa-Pro aminopeptidase